MGGVDGPFDSMKRAHGADDTGRRQRQQLAGALPPAACLWPSPPAPALKSSGWSKPPAKKPFCQLTRPSSRQSRRAGRHAPRRQARRLVHIRKTYHAAEKRSESLPRQAARGDEADASSHRAARRGP